MKKMKYFISEPWIPKKEWIEKYKKLYKTSKPVICKETGIIYKSISEASRATNISVQSISNAINGKSKTAGGFHWILKQNETKQSNDSRYR